VNNSKNHGNIDTRKSMNDTPLYARKDNGRQAHNPIQVLKSHFDAVREVYLTPDRKTLVSISEDMLINFWDFQNSFKYENIEPYCSVRTHTTPIFTLTGSPFFQKYYNVYTSGIDGVIRSIQIPENYNSKYRSSEDINIKAPWRAHQDMIWRLDYSPFDNFISSLSTDGTVKIFKANEECFPERLCIYC
jgi:WD40 repeat protein